MKSKSTIYLCSNCGEEFPKWFGQCPNCSAWGSLEEGVSIPVNPRSTKPQSSIQKIQDIELGQFERISSGLVEFDRVLGHTKTDGFVDSEVILLSGDPGIGKSTVLLQVLYNIHKKGLKSLYVSAEESVGQVSMRAKRLFGDIDDSYKELSLLSESNIENIISVLEKEKIQFVVLDSIQTVYSSDSKTIPGGIAQIKLSASRIINYAKENGIIIIIVGHINKDGVVAGPKVLEHLVDAVFQLEGDERTGIRTLRSLKNRFGPTMEVGMFIMSEKGLEDLSDPSKLFENSLDEDLVGVCKSVVIEGVRPIVVEVQSLTANTPFAMPKRVSEGFSNARLQRILAIISKYAKLDYSSMDVYCKVSSGLRIEDPALDLAIAVSLISSLKNIKISKNLVASGELGLTGNVMPVLRLKDRESESARLGRETFLSSKNVGKVTDILSLLRYSK
jgi:DNA repair protein RadA/Sms